MPRKVRSREGGFVVGSARDLSVPRGRARTRPARLHGGDASAAAMRRRPPRWRPITTGRKRRQPICRCIHTPASKS